MQTNKPFTIACIPAKDEEEKIAKVIVGAMKHVGKVIVCDDGSKDMTGEIARKLGAQVIRHERNLGYGAALSSLFKEAKEEKADIIVTIDADSQHNPDDIPKIIQPIINGEADVIIGSRFLNISSDQIPGYRKTGIKIITGLTKSIAHNQVTDAQSGFRAYNRKAIDLINIGEMGMGASTEILIVADENKLKIKEVPINIIYEENSSTYNPLYHGIDVVMSTIKHLTIRHPLIFFGIPGFTSILVALVFWIWTFQIFALEKQIITNIALIAIGTTVVGLMLLTTGTIIWVLLSALKERAVT